MSFEPRRLANHARIHLRDTNRASDHPGGSARPIHDKGVKTAWLGCYGGSTGNLGTLPKIG